MKIKGKQLINLIGIGGIVAGTSVMISNAVNYANLEDHRKNDIDYKRWNRLIRKARTQDVCEGKLGGKWSDNQCNEPSEIKEKERIILPSKYRKAENKQDCIEKGWYQRSSTSQCIEPGTIFMSKKEFDLDNNYEEIELNLEHRIFNNSNNIINLLKKGGSVKEETFKPKALANTAREKFILSFDPRTFSSLEYENYTFPKPLHGVLVEHLCSRLGYPDIFREKGGEKTDRYINLKDIYLYNQKNKLMWQCGYEKLVKLIPQ